MYVFVGKERNIKKWSHSVGTLIYLEEFSKTEKSESKKILIVFSKRIVNQSF
jgi:hypothetical protein